MEIADLVTFSEEILNEKRTFLCSEINDHFSKPLAFLSFFHNKRFTADIVLTH